MEKDIIKKALLEIKDLKEQNEKLNDDIAVIGIGCLFPDDIKSSDEFWRALLDNEDMIRVCDVKRKENFLDTNIQTKYMEKAGFLKRNVDSFDAALFHITPKEAERMDPQQKILLQVCWNALEDAGYAPDSLKYSETGVFIGCTSQDFGNELSKKRYLSKEMDPYDVTGSYHAFASGRVSYYYGFQGPSLTIDTACSSSLVAVEQARKALKFGECDLALAGGINILYSFETSKVLGNLNILSSNGKISPFDEYANGTVRGEGCGIVVLKRLAEAQRDHDKIYCILQGGSINQDGPSAGLTAPYGPSQEKLLKRAINNARISREQIGYIETHGTGTKLGDPIEISALANVFKKQSLYVGSVKSNIGHLEAAAGIASLIKAIYCVKTGLIPATLNFKTPSSYIDWDSNNIRVNNINVKWDNNGDERIAGVSSFGLSGTNAHIIVKEYVDAIQAENKMNINTQEKKNLPFRLSSNTQKGLKKQIVALNDFLVNYTDELDKLSYSLNRSKANLTYRIVMWGNSKEGIIEEINRLKSNEISSCVQLNLNKKKKVIFLFTGQGSQYQGMFRLLYESNKEFARAINLCDKYYREMTKENLIPIIFEGIKDINETEYTQPTLFAVEYALAYMLKQYGVEPDIMIGHSIGEYVAACIAEVFSLKDAIKLVIARGRLMQYETENGSMISVSASYDEINKIIKKYDVYIAATNSGNQTVISGKMDNIDRVIKELREKEIHFIKLKVKKAFHSPLMEAMEAEFRKVLNEITLKKPSKKIVSNLTGKIINDSIASVDYWIKHIMEEVKFYDSIRNLEKLENYSFVELGPKPILTNLVQNILEGKADVYNYYLNGKMDNRYVESCLMYLYTKGIDLNWSKFYSNFNYIQKKIPLYEFDSGIYGLQKIERETENEDDKFIENSVAKAIDISNIKKYIIRILGEELYLTEEALNEEPNLLVHGLNSLSVTRVLSRFVADMGIKVGNGEISSFIKGCTLDEWVNLLENKLKNETDQKNSKEVIEIYHDENKEFALTDVQQAYLLGRSMDFEWGGKSCCALYTLSISNLERERFERALHLLIDRHSMLRCYLTENGNQVIKSEKNLPLTFFDFSQMDSDKRENSLEEVKASMFNKIIPNDEPMFKISLIKENNRSWKIIFLIDFIIADALSVNIFWNDLYQLYIGNKLSKISIDYPSYLKEMKDSFNEKQYEIDKKYWGKKSINFPEMPELPIRIENLSSRFSRLKKVIEDQIWKKFCEKSARRGLTASTVLLSLYSEVISAWGGGSDYTIILTVFNRLNIHPDINKVIGDFTRLVPIDVHRKQISFLENAKCIQEIMYANIRHSTYSYREFLHELKTKKEKDILFPIVFTSALGLNEINDVKDEGSFIKNLECNISSTPQVWLDHQVYNEKGNVVLSWDYLEGLFYPGVIKSMFEKYIDLVYLLAEDDKIWDEVLDDLRPDTQKELHDRMNLTQQKLSGYGLLHSGFEYQAMKNSDNIAVVFDKKEYTYGQLKKAADKISEVLQNIEVKKGDYVAVFMKKSFEQIAAVIGILQCGAAYIPMTYDYPIERVKKILNKSGAETIIIDRREEKLGKEINQVIINDSVYQAKGEYEEVLVTESDLGYIIFTSGSTGAPKGVCITHGAAMNTINSISNIHKISHTDSVLAISSLSFDLSVFDIFGMLTQGGKIVLPTEEERVDPRAWKTLLIENRISVWNSVPAIMNILVEYIEKTGECEVFLKWVFLSGDWIPLMLPEKIKELQKNIRLISLGGATEASIWSNYFEVKEVEESWKSIPYGYPLPNQQFFVLDMFGRRCPDWVKGKLYISGKGLAEGYLNDSALTNRVFFWKDNLGKRLYDTGDFGRYQNRGILEFLGREDTQVKINGYRIEIAEIKRALKEIGYVKSSIEILGKDMENKQLVAFCESNDLNEFEVKNKLRERLPEYFIPTRIYGLDSLPITTNGKIDHDTLIKRASEEMQRKVNTSSGMLLDLIKKTLNLQEISLEDSFFKMGVSSIQMINLANALELNFGNRPTVTELMNYTSIAEVLEFYSNDKDGIAIEISQDKQESGENSIKLSFEDVLKSETILALIECICKKIKLQYVDKKLTYTAPAGAMTKKLQMRLKESKNELIVYFEKYGNLNYFYKKIDESKVPMRPIQVAYALGRNKEYELGNTSAFYYTEFEWEDIELKKLELSLNILIQKNDILRGVGFQDGYQIFLEKVPYLEIKARHFCNEEDFIRERHKWLKHKFPIGEWPMFKMQVAYIDKKIARVQFLFDCIMLDGYSAELLLNELYYCYYNGDVREKKFSYKEYILQEQQWIVKRDYYYKAKKYWESRMKKLPPAPYGLIKTEIQKVETPIFSRERLVLTEKQTERLKNQAQKYGVTLAAIICTIYMKTIYHISGENEFTLNLTLFNRLPLNKEIEKILGDFTNVTLIPYVHRKTTFIDEVKGISRLLWEAVENRSYNGLEILKKLANDEMGKAIMPVVFTSLLFEVDECDSIFSFCKEIYSISQTPQVALDHQAIIRNRKIILIWDYVTQIFSEEFIKDFTNCYRNIILWALNTENWEKEVIMEHDD